MQDRTKGQNVGMGLQGPFLEKFQNNGSFQCVRFYDFFQYTYFFIYCNHYRNLNTHFVTDVVYVNIVNWEEKFSRDFSCSDVALFKFWSLRLSQYRTHSDFLLRPHIPPLQL